MTRYDDPDYGRDIDVLERIDRNRFRALLEDSQQERQPAPYEGEYGAQWGLRGGAAVESWEKK